MHDGCAPPLALQPARSLPNCSTSHCSARLRPAPTEDVPRTGPCAPDPPQQFGISGRCTGWLACTSQRTRIRKPGLASATWSRWRGPAVPRPPNCPTRLTSWWQPDRWGHGRPVRTRETCSGPSQRDDRMDCSRSCAATRLKRDREVRPGRRPRQRGGPARRMPLAADAGVMLVSGGQGLALPGVDVAPAQVRECEQTEEDVAWENGLPLRWCGRGRQRSHELDGRRVDHQRRAFRRWGSATVRASFRSPGQMGFRW